MPPIRLTKAELEARGSWRAATRNTPTPADTSPEPTLELSDRELYYWNRVVGELRELGCLAHTDGKAIQRYAEMCAIWDRAVADIRKHGTYSVSDKGVENMRPSAKLIDQLANRLLQAENHLGLTPASRARINAKPPEPVEEDSTEEYLRVK